jgi:hypothetical protein
MEAGYCKRCDWGPHNVAEPQKENPTDPTRDTKGPYQSSTEEPRIWIPNEWEQFEPGDEEWDDEEEEWLLSQPEPEVTPLPVVEAPEEPPQSEPTSETDPLGERIQTLTELVAQVLTHKEESATRRKLVVKRDDDGRISSIEEA